MSRDTVIDMCGVTQLLNDELGLGSLETRLGWRTTGALPEWLDGADCLDDVRDEVNDVDLLQRSDWASEDSSAEETCSESVAIATTVEPETNPDFRIATLAFSSPEFSPIYTFEPFCELLLSSPSQLVSSVVIPTQAQPEPTPLVAEPMVPEAAPALILPPLEVSADGLFSINDLASMCVEPDPVVVTVSSPITAVAEANPKLLSTEVPLPALLVEEPAHQPRRHLLEPKDLLDAKLCLVMRSADRRWAIPLESVLRVTHLRGERLDEEAVVDMSEMASQPGRRSRRGRVLVIVDAERECDRIGLIVDEILGPRSLNWQPLDEADAEDDIPHWVTARAGYRGQCVELLDIHPLRHFATI